MANAHKLYHHALRDKAMMPVFAYGSAGTGKTYKAVEAAVEAMGNKEVQQIVCLRPPVPFAGIHETLPGDEREKMEPFTRPIIQNMRHFAPKGTIESWERNERLLFYPLAYAQGMTFDNAFIIVDECQNMNYEQIKGLVTRTGKWSKLVLCGDIAQVSPKFPDSGLAEWLDMIEYLDLPIHTIEFNVEDVKRGDVCRMAVAACEEWERLCG